MSTLDRRLLFSLVGAAVGGALVPDWLALALAIQGPVSAWRVKQLREAIARAKKANRPLLVLVAPTANDGNVRGKWFGAWFEGMPDEDLWLPASCELACATVAELGDALGAKVEGAPFWVFADVGASGDDKKPARITPIACELPIPDRNDPFAARAPGLQKMHEAFVAGAKKHGLALASFAAAALRRLDARQQSGSDEWFADRSGLEFVAIAFADADARRRVEAQRPQIKEDLLRDRVVHSFYEPIAGARWMDLSPRGNCTSPNFVHPTKSETETRRREQERELVSIACGMGLVRSISFRFLEFWTAGD